MRNDLEDIDRTVVSLRALVSGSLDPAEVFKFEICSSEALTNLVRHAETSDRSVPIILKISEHPDAVVLDIFDPIGAVPFDIRDHASALEDVDPFAESGRGLGLIMQCADHAEYGPKDDRMCLSLTFSKSGN